MMAKLRALRGKKDYDEKQAAKPNYFSTLAGTREKFKLRPQN